MTNNALLRVKHLKKYFPVRKGIFSSFGSGAKRSYVRAVDDISFTLQEKEILGFVGESGCGKSTHKSESHIDQHLYHLPA